MAAITVAAALLGLATASTLISVHAAVEWRVLGADLNVVTALGHRWLETGSLYVPYQLSGPYAVTVTPDLAQTPGLYPPAAGPVFGLLALVPAPALVLWWAIPIGVLVTTVARWRPAWWTWPLIAACLAWPQTLWQLLVGGTTMWMAALVALGFSKPSLTGMILLKPTLAPFALLGIRSRRWWLVTAGLVGLTLIGPWQAFLAAIANASDTGGLLYSLGHYGLMFIPLLAWVGRRSDRPALTRAVGAGAPQG